MTPDEALEQVAALTRTEDEGLRSEILGILKQVRASGYSAGVREGFDQGSDHW
jgi:hypothetical protein